MVVALMTLVALSEVNVLGHPSLSGWSLQGVTPMKEQLSVFSTARRLLRWVVESGGVEWSRWILFVTFPGAIIEGIK